MKPNADSSVEDAWINEFGRACHEFCAGSADYELIYALAEDLLPIGMTIDPRKVAELASVALAFTMPGVGGIDRAL
ncbi:hypothetical protein [Variovorax sp. V213]|jgi:hypothetical protein|uniref:hypothetical protein n=1 Tax=Variovorax sp. V213 TaxID=3065955 RepID=UPI0034E8A9FD